ncbi:MAG: hypothetical protein IJV62_01765, partial [Eggerthellaceae bacterium]|nr:hypothetical protein [Eggerthellaceae bacterium]
MGANKHDTLQASEEDLFQGLDIIAGEPIHTTDAHVILSNQEGTRQKEDTTFQSEQSVKATKSFRIKSIIAISLGLFIVGVVALFLTHEHSPFYIDSISSNNVSQQPASSSQDNTTQDKSTSKIILNNDEIFTTLTEA